MLPLLPLISKGYERTQLVQGLRFSLNAVRFINFSPTWWNLTSGGFQEDTILLSQMQGLHYQGEAIYSQGTRFPEVCHDSRLLLVVVVFAPPLVAFGIPATTELIKLIILDFIHQILKPSCVCIYKAKAKLTLSNSSKVWTIRKTNEIRLISSEMCSSWDNRSYTFFFLP